MLFAVITVACIVVIVGYILFSTTTEYVEESPDIELAAGESQQDAA